MTHETFFNMLDGADETMLAEALHTERKITHHRKKRGLRIAIAAAAAAMICGTVTVGAMNSWDMSTLFIRYFSIRDGEEVSADSAVDLTDHATDITRTLQGEGYTLTLQSVLADSASVCVLYEVQFDEDTQEMLDDNAGAKIQVFSGLTAEVQAIGHRIDGTTMPVGFFDSTMHEDKEAGVWRGIDTCSILWTHTEGAELVIHPCDLSIHIGDKTHLSLRMQASDIRIPFPELTQAPVQTFACDVTLENDRNHVRYTQAEFGVMHLLLSDSGVRKEPVTGTSHFVPDPLYTDVTLLYADGTEYTVPALTSARAGDSVTDDSSPNYNYHTELCYSFTEPVPTEGITAVRIGTTEIALQANGQ